MATQRGFKERSLDRRFQRDGFVVAPFAPCEVLRELREVYDRLDGGRDHGYYASMHSPDQAYKQRADVEIRVRVQPFLDDMLADHEPVVGAFMIKHPGEDSWVPPHQDWIVTDESVARGINCWFPITEVTDEVGKMGVLRGSHRYVRGLRGSPGFPTQIGSICREIADELLEPVDVAVGEAIFYDNRLVHGTPPNRSGDVRVVAYVNSIPVGAPRVHYFIDDEGTVEGYEVDADFFTTFNIGERPRGRRFVRLPDYSVPELTIEEVSSMRTGSQRRRRLRSLVR